MEEVYSDVKKFINSSLWLYFGFSNIVMAHSSVGQKIHILERQFLFIQEDLAWPIKVGLFPHPVPSDCQRKGTYQMLRTVDRNKVRHYLLIQTIGLNWTIPPPTSWTKKELWKAKSADYFSTVFICKLQYIPSLSTSPANSSRYSTVILQSWNRGKCLKHLFVSGGEFQKS